MTASGALEETVAMRKVIADAEPPPRPMREVTVRMPHALRCSSDADRVCKNAILM